MNKGSLTVVVGGQFGSEAKGKVVAYLAREADLAIRTGAPNAGHTVVKDGKTHRLQQVPTAFVNPSCRLAIGAGGLIDPAILAREVAELGVGDRLVVDFQAGLIEPEHAAQEGELVKQIGSTGKGCGAALADRVWRRGRLARDLGPEGLGVELADVSLLANDLLDSGGRVLLEGTQGYGLSLYHGHYPHVTSRDTTAAGFLAEAGLGPLSVTEVILVIRTYPIRVAGPSGPLPGEISWEELSERAGRDLVERTTVTNKVRRVAEFDIEIVKRAIKANRPTGIALMFLDYLFPEDAGKDDWDSLSKEAQAYVLDLEGKLGVPVTLLGTGAEHEALVDRR